MCVSATPQQITLGGFRKQAEQIMGFRLGSSVPVWYLLLVPALLEFPPCLPLMIDCD